MSDAHAVILFCSIGVFYVVLRSYVHPRRKKSMNESLAAQLVGSRVLLSTGHFTGPDGQWYSAVVGTLRGVRSAEATLGVRPNGRSANWYIEIGRMVIAGCQVNYAIRIDPGDAVNLGDVIEDRWNSAGDLVVEQTRTSMTFDADA